jgi:hypothetical protein
MTLLPPSSIVQASEASDRPSSSDAVPWRAKELRHFWALARKVGANKDDVAAIVLNTYKKHALRELTRPEWMGLIWHFRCAADPGYGCSSEQWDRIKWLQHEIGWDDRHLENYIKKFGHIDHTRFLCGVTARKIIVGLQKIVDYVPAEEEQGEKTQGPIPN